jgi:hypothetical protein
VGQYDLCEELMVALMAMDRSTNGRPILTTSSWKHHRFLKPFTASGDRFTDVKDSTETGRTPCQRGQEEEQRNYLSTKKPK